MVVNNAIDIRMIRTCRIHLTNSLIPWTGRPDNEIHPDSWISTETHYMGIQFTKRMPVSLNRQYLYFTLCMIVVRQFVFYIVFSQTSKIIIL